MNHEQILAITRKGIYQGSPILGDLIETHISWVILTERFVFKIKKPIRYSFLDFSSLEKRHFYCQRELVLNQRLSDIYLDVVPIRLHNGTYFLGANSGETIDYAVRMKRLMASRKMDVLLRKNQLTLEHIEKLADKIACFHHDSQIISKPYSLSKLKADYNDLAGINDYVKSQLGVKWEKIIRKAVSVNEHFLFSNNDLLKRRVRMGFRRDVHGDLHAKNIFIYEDPVIFDCIEFNDAFRQIDLLNELAFFCMDLESFGREDLSRHFISLYLDKLPCIHSPEDTKLFIYYKSYRANVRAKVNALRAIQADNSGLHQYLSEVRKYLDLLNRYLYQLEN